MAHKDFLTASDAGVLQFAVAFARNLGADPAGFGISAADADAVAAAVADYEAAYGRAVDPAERTGVAVLVKNQSRRKLETTIRRIARAIQARPDVSPEKRTVLGLKLRGRSRRTPPPATAPLLSLLGMDHRRQTIRLADAQRPDSPARPAGVAGAELYIFIGDDPPPEIHRWRYAGVHRTTRVSLSFTAEEARQSVHIRARWCNTTYQPGPLSAPLAIRVAA